MHVEDHRQLTRQIALQLERLQAHLGTLIVGKQEQIHQCVVCLLAGGHLLIEDLPGVGKTTLAHGLAMALGLRYARAQFTADLMPADLIGVSVYDRQAEAFSFHPGPIFAQVLLADEINRAGPRTQSALLEAMEEGQVSLDGRTHALPEPFFVIATQNPAEQLGTYALPESQLDRFLMRIHLGYPDRAAERALLAGEDRRALLRQFAAVMRPADLAAAQSLLPRLHVAPALLDYVQALTALTRDGRWFRHGLSPRAALALLRAARAEALLRGQDHVSPDDVLAVAPAVLAHRLQPAAGAGRGATEQLRAMLEALGPF